MKKSADARGGGLIVVIWDTVTRAGRWSLKAPTHHDVDVNET